MVQADREVRRLFGRIAWPASVEGLLLVLLSSVDLIMVSGLGAQAAAAVGVFSQPKLVLLCAPRAFSVAVTVRCSHLYGQKQQSALANSLKQALVVSGAFPTKISVQMDAKFRPLSTAPTKVTKNRLFLRTSGFNWYARCDSNARPLESESNALSS